MDIVVPPPDELCRLPMKAFLIYLLALDVLLNVRQQLEGNELI